VILDVNEFRDEVNEASAEFKRCAPAVYQQYRVKRRLNERLAAIVARLDRNEPAETTKAIEDLKGLRTYFQTVREMWARLAQLARGAKKVEVLVKTLPLSIDPDEVPALEQARYLLETRFDDGLPDEGSTSLTARKKAVDDTGDLLEELERWLPEAAKLRAAALQLSDGGLADHKKELLKAVSELVAAQSAEDARKSMSTVLSEAGQIRGLLATPFPPPPSRGREEEVPSEPPESKFEAYLAEAPQPLTTTAEKKRQFEMTDRQMTLATGVLAVFSGLVTLYVTSATWGAPGDYLKAFLWGSVVSEGTKAVAAIVGRTGLTAG
jgi:hypothetical protein